MMRLREWFEVKLGGWGAFAARRHARILWGALLFTAVLLPFAWHAVKHLDLNLFNQASGGMVRFGVMRELSEDFGGDVLAAVATIPDAHTPKQVKELKRFGDLFAAELGKAGTLPEDRAALNEALQTQLKPETPWLRNVECRVGQGIEQTLKTIARQRPYVILNAGDVAALKKMFEPDALDAAMARIAATLEDLPPNSAEKARLREDPLGIEELARKTLHERLTQRRQTLSRDADGYFITPDGSMLVVLARTALPATRLDFNRALIGAVQRAENRAVTAFRLQNPAPELSTALKGAAFGELAVGETAGSLQAGFTGMPAIAVENESTLRYELLTNTAVSLLGVLLLFLIIYRSAALTADVMWTTMLTILWTIAVAGLTRGSISLLGGAFTAVPVGLGTDYTILVYNTFHALRRERELSAEEALRRTLARCGPSILLAAAITAIAFFGVGFTSLKGLAEFGFLGGVSALLGAVVMLTIFPAALCLRQWDEEGRDDIEDAGDAKKVEGVQDNVPLGFGIPAWGRMLERPAVRRAALLSGLLALGLSVALTKFGPDPGPETVAGVRFDPELGNLRTLHAKAIPLRNVVAKKFGLGLADIRVIVEAEDEEHAFAGAEEATARLRPWVQRGELTPNSNILDLIPSARQQRENIEALKSFGPEAASKAFLAAATARFKEKGQVFFKPFLQTLSEFGRLTREPHPLTLAALMDGPLANVLAPYVKLDAPSPRPRVRLVFSWFPSQLALPETWYDGVAAALEQNPPEGVKVRMTAARMVGFELKRSTLRDCEWITIAVGLCVALSLGLALRSLASSLLAVIPLLFAYAFMLAGVPFSQLMGWDFSLNFVNLIMFPLLMGSAVDYGVYLVFDASSPRRPSISEVVAQTGRSVLYCMGTTFIGFGSFIFSSYTGLISIGVASLFGYAGALFGALVVLPALLGSLKQHGSDRT